MTDGVGLSFQDPPVFGASVEREPDLVRGARRALSQRLRSWLGTGACQSGSGAFAAWVDTGTRALAFDYPEITGYALTYFAWRGDSRVEEQQAARRAVSWLRNRIDAGSLRARDGWDGEAVYHFDLGIIAHGLLSHGHASGDRTSVSTGLRLTALLRDQIAEHGSLSALAPESSHRSTRKAWSTEGEAHLTKLVQGLLMANKLGQQGALEAAATLIARCRILQGEEARIPTEPGALTSLHPLLYACEGLWIWGVAMHDSDALARARRAVGWVFGHQLANGGFPGQVGPLPASAEQSDVTAQAVRLAVLLGLPGLHVDKALARLDALAGTEPTGAGLFYRPNLPHVNCWSTLFASQAIELSVFGSDRFSWGDLV